MVVKPTCLAAILVLIAVPVTLSSRARQDPQPEKVYVIGAVNGPGVYRYEIAMTVQIAIERARGLTSRANPSAITIKRRGRRRPESATLETPVLAGDVISVPFRDDDSR